MSGLAKAEWSSGAYGLISFGFPGLYYPGLLTLGPSLHLYAQLSGEISLYGQLSTSVGYTFPVRICRKGTHCMYALTTYTQSINYAIGSKTDEPTLGSDLTGSTANNNGYNYGASRCDLIYILSNYASPRFWLQRRTQRWSHSLLDPKSRTRPHHPWRFRHGCNGMNLILRGHLPSFDFPQAYVQAELYAGLNLNGSVSEAVR